MSDSNLNSRKEKAAWGLSIPRGTARGLLDIEFTTRRALLEELTRVNPDRALLVLRQQPDAAP